MENQKKVMTMDALGKYEALHPQIKPVDATYEEMVEMQELGVLLPGQWYRITDYTTAGSVFGENTGKALDILVQALTDTVLSENAKAVCHEGSTDFEDDVVNAWQLKYCLENDTDRFPESSTTQGVVYVLRDAEGTETVEEGYEYTSAKIAALESAVASLQKCVEGYVRVAGSSSPTLSYKNYKFSEMSGLGIESAFAALQPCLVGTALTGSGTEGKILHVLKKLDYYHDTDGNDRLIDGSEGDVQIVNTENLYIINGKYTVAATEYDVFLVSLQPFTWQGIEATLVPKQGMAPDYCVAHADEDGVTRMHSAYNEEWNGSYTAPVGVVGKYVYSQDADTGEITEEYDADATLLGGAGGCHTTDVNLPTGEQYAMNNNDDTTKTVPFMNSTAAIVELMFSLMLAEGGTFDAHKKELMGSGFCSNDQASSDTDFTTGINAVNGMRYVNSSDAYAYLSLGASITSLGLTGNVATMINSWRNPWKIMEAHRAVMYAVANSVGENEWFVYDGNKYKYRSVEGFAGPAAGEMTCVVWKLMSTKFGSGVVDPSDSTTSIEGNRVDFLVSTALFHGITTQVSPSWWTSGLIFTEDENGQYKAYMQRDQASLIKSPTSDIDATENYDFENSYDLVGTFAKGEGYAKDYTNDALMIPNSDDNKSGASLHTYVCKYNWFTGSNAATGKKWVRGFRRGFSANLSHLSPLSVFGNFAPSAANPCIGFGTCVQIVE